MIFKPVPKANEYEMSMDGDIRRVDGAECTLTIMNNEPAITLTIFNEVRTLSIEWLRLITHFEVDLPKKYFFNIYFIDTKDWQKGNRVKKTMWFDGPRPEYKPGFRYVPEFTRYAVSKEGKVIDTYTGQSVLYEGQKNTKYYLTVRIYDSDKNTIRSVIVHRLVALAWVKNPNPLKYYLVNHIDGNKHNPHYSNLEWTDHGGNIDHAYDSGLRSQNLPCKVRNVESNVVKEFSSLREACVFMGVSYRSYDEFLRWNKNRAINGQFEIKLLSDSTEWNYGLSKLSNTSCRSKITLTCNDRQPIVLYGLKALQSYFNLPHNTKKFSTGIKRAKDLGYEVKVETIGNDRISSQPIQVYCVVENKVLDFNSIPLASKYLNVNPSTIRHTLSKGETFVTNGFAYRYKTDKKWNTNFSEAINRPVCILAINSDGKEYECESLRQAETITNINRKAIRRALKGLTIQTNWHFVYKY